MVGVCRQATNGLHDCVERELHLRGIDLLGLLAEDVSAQSLQLDAGELVELAIFVALVGRAQKLFLQVLDPRFKLAKRHGRRVYSPRADL